MLTFFLLLSFNCNFWVNIKSQLFDSFIFILLGFSLGFLAKLLCFIIRCCSYIVPNKFSNLSRKKACHGYSSCNGICLVSVPDILKPDVPIPLSLLWPRLAGGFMRRIIYFRDSVYLSGGGQRRVAARKILHYCIPPPHPGRIWPLWRGGGGGAGNKK